MTKKIKLLIILSIILNIVFIGMIVGHGYNHYSNHKESKLIVLLEKSSIATDKKELFIKQFQAIFTKEKKKKSKRQWREESIAILTAEPFDVEAYRNHLNKILNHQQKSKEQIIELIVAIATELNAQERKKLAYIFRHAAK